MIERSTAARLDDDDPLAAWRRKFVDPGVVYLDGNSLGMAPVATIDRVDTVLKEEWAGGLIRSWDHWLDLPTRVGDRLAPIIGAPPGTVVIHDSTTVNLYQAIHAGASLAATRRGTPSRPPVIAVDAADFPTDRYVADGIASTLAGRLVPTVDDLDGVDVAVRSLVDYRTAALVDLAAETRRAQATGTVVVWDLSHAAGAVELDVQAAGVDIAVGCTYKYLNGGPGAPAWTYIADHLADAIGQPIWGWFAQRDQFEMADVFDPHPGPRRFLLGTPGVLGLAAAEIGIGIVGDAGIAPIAAKGRRLTGFALDLCDQHALASPTPRDPHRRGAHVAVRVAADSLDDVHRSLTERGVIVDKRRPDLLRLGCSPLTTRFVDVYDGVAAIAETVG